jgi:predicted HTH transcriptional regulator
VHRDYQTPELAEIDIDVGRAIRFHNPGDLGNELREQLHVDDSGRFRPVRTLSEIRNPSIADIFFGIRSMERAGTGLGDVEDEIRRAGGDVEFTYGSALCFG